VSQLVPALERSKWRTKVALSGEVDKPGRNGLVDRVWGVRNGRRLDAGLGRAILSQGPLLLRPTKAVHLERALTAHSRTASRGGPRASHRAGHHARPRARPRTRLRADTVGRYRAPPIFHMGDRGVVLTNTPGRRFQSDTPWIRNHQLAWMVTHCRGRP